METILVVDDSGFQRRWAIAALKALPYQFVEAQNGAEALEKMEECKPVLVISDLNMPVMGGIECLETMRSRGLPYPVMVVTADIQETTRKHCYELGAKAVVHKPIDADNLNSVVTRVLTSLGVLHDA